MTNLHISADRGEVRRFRAPSFDEALAAATDELGADIDVVEANRIRRGGLGGFFATDLGVEVIVATKPPSERSRHVTEAVDRLLERFGDDGGDRFVPHTDPDFHLPVDAPDFVDDHRDRRTDDRVEEDIWADVPQATRNAPHPFADLLEQELKALVPDEDPQPRGSLAMPAIPVPDLRLGDEVELVETPAYRPEPILDAVLEFPVEPIRQDWVLDGDAFNIDATRPTGMHRVDSVIEMPDDAPTSDPLSELDALLRQAGVDTQALNAALADDGEIVIVDEEADSGADDVVAPGRVDARVTESVIDVAVDVDATRPLERVELASTDLVLQAADRLATQVAVLESAGGAPAAGLRRMKVKIMSPDGTRVEMSAEWGERG